MEGFLKSGMYFISAIEFTRLSIKTCDESCAAKVKVYYSMDINALTHGFSYIRNVTAWDSPPATIISMCDEVLA
jgi:hypothetical protein